MEGETINYPRDNWVPGLKIAPEGLSWERGFFGKMNFSYSLWESNIGFVHPASHHPSRKPMGY